jgi:hypothetical protein
LAGNRAAERRRARVYRVVETREAIVLGGIAVVMLVGTAFIVQRRRPG